MLVRLVGCAGHRGDWVGEQAALTYRCAQAAPLRSVIAMQAEEVGRGQVVHDEVEGLVSLRLGLDPVGALEPLHVADHLALGHALVEEVRRQVCGEVQRPGAILEVVAVVDPVLRRVGADHP